MPSSPAGNADTLATCLDACFDCVQVCTTCADASMSEVCMSEVCMSEACEDACRALLQIAPRLRM